jgi:uncharacterized repeat protein (TIGR01451 family)
VPANDQISFSFEAVAIGYPLQKYGNHLSAYSPWTSIPDRGDKAKVEIDPPLGISKSVTPQDTFVEQTVHYDVHICNIALGNYTLDQFVDYLSTGFYVGGANPYVHDISPPRVIAPGECWDHGFDARVTIDVGCQILPETYKNGKTKVQIHVSDPVDAWFANASDMAPLDVNAHVKIIKDRDHIAVLPGETFVYTITLDNNSSIPVSNITIIDTLPDGFDYMEMVQGPNPYDTEEPTIAWQGLTVLADSQLVLAFRIDVPEDQTLTKYKNEVEGWTTDLACIEGTGETAQVEVADQIIAIEKKANPEEVPGVVRYELELKNRDSVPIPDVTVIDTLPGVLGQYFEFLGMAEGYPEPSEVNGPQLIWRNLTIPGQTTLWLRFDAQSPVLFGNYHNQIVASCPRQYIEPPVEDIEATVTMLPGVVLYKTAFPTFTTNGGTVVYTVTLNNQWTKALEDIRTTDTLPAGFEYRRTLAGPTPIQQSPVVAWELDRLDKGKSQDFVFQVGVGFRVISGTYFNEVRGHSPSAQIPGVDETAPVEVEAGDISLVFLPIVHRAYAQ